MKASQLPKIIKNTLNIPLITKYKQKLKIKEIKNIRNNLLNLAKLDLSESNQFKVKTLINKEEEKKEKDFSMISPVYFKYYFEDFKKLKTIEPQTKKEEDEITPSSNANTVKQIESSDVSVDEEETIL